MNNIFYFIDDNNEIYTINNRELKKIDFANLESGFDIKMLSSISSDTLIKYSPLRLCLISDLNIENVRINQNNSFMIIDTSSCQNIHLKNKHLMLVSNDKKTWFNYYDERINNVFKSEDKYEIMRYINTKCKMNNFINSKYNYLFIKLNKDETLNSIFTQIEPDYIACCEKISILENKIVSSGNVINILESHTNNMLSMEDFK